MKEEVNVHSFLSPSAAHRWLACTPSARIEAMFPAAGSAVAEEGTLAHHLAQISLLRMIGAIGSHEAFQMLKEAQGNNYYSVEMNDFVSAYVDAVNDEIMHEEGEVVEVERKLDLSQLVPGCFGTADALIARRGEVHIFDLKYGKGVKVEAQNNPQLMLYALGVCEAYKAAIGEGDAFVTLHIVQPRLNAHTVWQTKVKELKEWQNKVLQPKAMEAYTGSGNFVTGEHCRFCKAKGVCRKLADEASGINDKAVALLSLDEISEKLAKIPVVELWCKALQEHALRQALNGVEIPNYKVVAGRSIRKYANEGAMLEALKANGVDEKAVTRVSLIALTELEKMLGKDEVNRMYGGLIVKPEGKPTLVPVTDKRPAIDAASDFMDVKLN